MILLLVIFYILGNMLLKLRFLITVVERIGGEVRYVYLGLFGFRICVFKY